MPDDLTVVFLYCPFYGQVFRDAFQRLLDSVDRVPRELRVVYAYPWEHDWLVRAGRVAVEHVAPAQWPTKPWWWRTGLVIGLFTMIMGRRWGTRSLSWA